MRARREGEAMPGAGESREGQGATVETAIPPADAPDTREDGRDSEPVRGAGDDVRDGGERADDSNDAPPPDEPAGQPDYYARLGVSPDATPDELRHAYLRLVKLWHPDRYTHAPDALRERAERRMRQINEAYEALRDATARDEYDAARSGAVGRASPVGETINVFGQRSTAYESATLDENASANPNGAGDLFGALALIVGLGLLGGALGGGHISGVGLVAVLAVVVALLVAALFFMSGSPLARAANNLMEGNPGSNGADGSPSHDTRAPDAEPVGADDAASADSGADEGAAVFAALVEEALTSVPAAFEPYLRNVIVRVEDEPDAATLRLANVPPGHTLLGLYHGVNLTNRGAHEPQTEMISIYRGPIERYCGGDLARIRRQVRATTLHELAHHFGIEHEEMPEWVK